MTNEQDHAAIQKAAAMITQAESLIISAGAGIGVDSGLPDFRGNEGFWSVYPALRSAGINFRSIASPSAFHADPALAWGFYGHRLDIYRRTAPHAGFSILKRWGENLPGGYRVFTSNVDGQFQKAGFGDEKVFECHGSIHHLQCLKPCSSAIWSVDDFSPEIDMAACRLRNAPPTCPHCGGPTRPNILMFNDTGWCDSREVRQSIQQDRWLATVTRPVVIELGAGTDIPTVRNFGTRVVRHHGGHLVRINPRECGIANSAEIGLRMGAVEALRGIAAALGEPWAPYETVVI